MFRTEEDNRPNGHDLERRGTARPNTPMMRRSRRHHQGEGSARPAVDNDAGLEYQELDRRPPSPGVANSSKRSKKNKTKKRKKRKNYQKDSKAATRSS